jgi:hypothetical protein
VRVSHRQLLNIKHPIQRMGCFFMPVEKMKSRNKKEAEIAFIERFEPLKHRILYVKNKQ